MAADRDVPRVAALPEGDREREEVLRAPLERERDADAERRLGGGEDLGEDAAEVAVVVEREDLARIAGGGEGRRQVAEAEVLFELRTDEGDPHHGGTSWLRRPPEEAGVWGRSRPLEMARGDGAAGGPIAKWPPEEAGVWGRSRPHREHAGEPNTAAWKKKRRGQPILDATVPRASHPRPCVSPATLASFSSRSPALLLAARSRLPWRRLPPRPRLRRAEPAAPAALAFAPPATVQLGGSCDELSAAYLKECQDKPAACAETSKAPARPCRTGRSSTTAPF